MTKTVCQRSPHADPCLIASQPPARVTVHLPDDSSSCERDTARSRSATQPAGRSGHGLRAPDHYGTAVSPCEGRGCRSSDTSEPLIQRPIMKLRRGTGYASSIGSADRIDRISSQTPQCSAHSVRLKIQSKRHSSTALLRGRQIRRTGFATRAPVLSNLNSPISAAGVCNHDLVRPQNA